MPVISLPGPVEIDECHIGGRVKGSHGRLPAENKIIFGIFCRTTKNVLLFSVLDKKKETLLPLIIEYVDQGAEIFSDKFSTYVTRNGKSHIEEFGYDHYYINHSVQFVDPVQPFIHTNGIERTWRSLKASISHSKRNVPQDKIQTYLDSFQFHRFFSKDSLHDALIQMIVALNK